MCTIHTLCCLHTIHTLYIHYTYTIHTLYIHYPTSIPPRTHPHKYPPCSAHTVPIDPINDRPRIMAATTAHDMYNILQVDSWVLVHIHSVSRNQGGAAGDMEGTRLTIVKVKDVPDGYEFSIRTPVTPQRWAQFDKVCLVGGWGWCACGVGGVGV